MKNKYVPEKMIQKSRFRDFYGQWENSDKKNLVRIMSRLIKENPDYADRKNYGHMCNLVTSLAMVMILEEKGVPCSEAQNAVAQAMYLFVQPQIASMQKLGSKPWFVGMLRTCLHKHMHTSFRQILLHTALKILAVRQHACGFLPCLHQNYARKSAYISYEDRFLKFLCLLSSDIRWTMAGTWNFQSAAKTLLL